MRAHGLGILGWTVTFAATVASAQNTPEDLQVVVGSRQATITWSTQGDSTTEISWGDAGVLAGTNYQFSSKPVDAGLAQRHSVTIGVAQGVKTFFSVQSRGAGGGIGSSPEVVIEPPVDPTIPVQAWVPNGPVRALAQQGSIVYFGGTFDWVGRLRGRGFALTPVGWASPIAGTGLVTTTNPIIDGTVCAAISDGLGGFYLGGEFSLVGALTRHHLAHLLPDMGIDPAWAPDVDGPVYALALSNAGDVLYVGGAFTRVAGASHSNAAAVSVRSGDALPWDPSPGGAVRAIAVSPSGVSPAAVYLGGAFTTITTQAAPAPFFAAVHPVLGTPVFQLMGLTGDVRALAWSPETSRLYLGGSFQTHLKAIDSNGQVQSWPVTTSVGSTNSGDVLALATSGSRLFIGGDFRTLTDASGMVTRSNLAVVELGTNTADSTWSPEPFGPVRSIALANGIAYFGGDFTTSRGASRRYLDAIGMGSNPALPLWSADVNGPVRALAASTTGALFAGGSFTGVVSEGRPRLNAAAWDLQTGSLAPWNPTATASVLEASVNALMLAPSGTSMYLGGDFSLLGSDLHSTLGRVDLQDGGAEPWQVGTTGTVAQVSCLAASAGGRVYAGGEFSLASSSPFTTPAARGNAAAFLDGGGLEPWNPSFGNSVLAMAAFQDSLFVGGTFATAVTSPGPLSFAARFSTDPLDENPLPWLPEFNGPVRALTIGQGGLYAGGDFKIPHNRAAAFVVDSGVLLPWDPDANAPVLAISAPGSITTGVFLGGTFTALKANTIPSPFAARVDATTGLPRGWGPSFTGSAVRAISIDDGCTLMGYGGSFDGTVGTASPYLAIFTALPGCRVPPSVFTLPPTSVTATTATLNGQVAANANPGTVGFFRWGEADGSEICATTWGTMTPSDGGLPADAGVTAFSQPITGLAAGKTYAVCAMAWDPPDRFTAGILLAFTTPDGGTADAGTDAGACPDLRIVPQPVPEARCGVTWAYRPGLCGAKGGVTWSAPESPAGMAVDPGTGVLTWTPKPAQRGEPNAVVLEVTDHFTVDRQGFNVTVQCPDSVAFTACGCSSDGGALTVLLAGLLGLRRRRRAR